MIIAAQATIVRMIYLPVEEKRSGIPLPKYTIGNTVIRFQKALEEKKRISSGA
jgi:hypothetical protein